MELRHWLAELPREIVFDEVYKGSAGMLPFMAVVTWGGVFVMGATIAAPGMLTNLARVAVRELGEQLGKLLAEDAIVGRIIRKAAPQLLTMLVTAIMNCFPQPRAPARPPDLGRGFRPGAGCQTVAGSKNFFKYDA
jgi:hypothetical protein